MTLSEKLRACDLHIFAMEAEALERALDEIVADAQESARLAEQAAREGRLVNLARYRANGRG